MVNDEVRSRKHPRRIATLLVCLIGTIAILPMIAGPAGAQEAGGGDNLPRFWEIHAFLMTAGTIIFVGTYVALWLKYVSRWKGFQLPALAVKVSRLWYRLHVYLGIAGVSLLAIGTIWGYIIVDIAHHGQHLRLSHSFIGVFAGCIALVPLALGFTVKRLKGRRAAIEWWHVALGMAGIVIMLVALSSGWALE